MHQMSKSENGLDFKRVFEEELLFSEDLPAKPSSKPKARNSLRSGGKVIAVALRAKMRQFQ